jgi:hypothetical protein
MLKNSVFRIISILLVLLSFASCDKEFSVVGEGIIVGNSFDIVKEEFPAIAYNQKLQAIQSNNLEVNAFGIYENPSFGTTRANFVTQLSLQNESTTYDKTATIKSVVLTVPYFVDNTQTRYDSSTTTTTYVLDSIYGTPLKSKMKLSIYESGFYMRDLDPEEQFLEPQKYYNDQYNDFYSNIIPLQTAPYYLNDDKNPSQNLEFFFDPSELVNTVTNDDATGSVVTTKTAPGMQLNLNKEFFQEKLFGVGGASAGSLAKNDVFKNYFRGLFFNIEAINGNPGNLAMINFRAGKITVVYTETINSKTTDKTMVLTLTGNTVSLLDESNSNSKYVSATNKDNINTVQGDANLYVKGGAGAMSIIELFGNEDKYGADGVSGTPNGVSDKLDEMRTNKYLINQAELTFHLNTSEMSSSAIPQRVYLYDYTNDQVLIDYFDRTTISTNLKKSKYVFGGLLAKETTENGGGYFYKFRITDHIRNLVKNKDSTNVKIGLVVTEDINKSQFYALKDKNGVPLFSPIASVMNPLGAILFGSNLPIEDKKRMKFEIYYTKPN